MHKFFSKAEILWVEMIWEKHYANGKLPTSTKKQPFWWRDNLKRFRALNR
jgi:hypothetical protein